MWSVIEYIQNHPFYNERNEFYKISGARRMTNARSLIKKTAKQLGVSLTPDEIENGAWVLAGV